MVSAEWIVPNDGCSSIDAAIRLSLIAYPKENMPLKSKLKKVRKERKS